MDSQMDPFMETLIEAVQHIQSSVRNRVYVMNEHGRLVELEQQPSPPLSSASSVSISLPDRRIDSYGDYFRGDINFESTKDIECMIMQDKIEDGELYNKCDLCQHCVSVDAMREWWGECRRRNKSPSCPHCRKEWENNIIYCYSSS